ncbi:MAG TPA: dTMP kinase [Gemmatimonadales bacterium]|nr:dTMP kinase [Gemmatimonadales bacterium]
MNPAPGLFVVLEGPEGAGKSTLAAALVARYRAAGVEPVLVREPGGTPAAEALRAELLDAHREWTAESELLYMVTARADLVARVIRPALGAGRLVISDRFDLSTRAYQGAGRGVNPDYLEWANRAATGGLEPDLTLVLDLPVVTGLARQVAAGKRQDRLDREDEAFHRRVAEYYLAAEGPQLHHLDAAVPPGELLQHTWELIEAARNAP